MFIPSFRPLTFGEILDGAFTLYRRHFLTFFVTALVPYVPVAIVSGQMAGADPAEDFSGYFGLLFVAMVVMFVAFVLMWGALTREAAQAYGGGEVSMGDGFGRGLRAFLPGLAAAFVAVLMMSVVGGVLSMVVGVVFALAIPAAAAGGGSAVPFVLVSVFSFLLIMAVMLGMGSLFFAVTPVLVVEGRGPFEAIGRSFTLAWGALPRVVGVMVVSYLIAILPLAASMIGIGITQGFEAMVTAGGMSPAAIAVQQVISAVGYALTLPFFATTLVLLYYDRRARTEAHDLEGMVQGLAAAAG